MTSPTPTALCLSDVPPLGAPLAGGTFCGLITLADGTHHAVVLLPDISPTDLTHQRALAWAASVGGTLPTRPVAALLYSTRKPVLRPCWHWISEAIDADTSDADDASYAWFCFFLNGSQVNGHKSAEGAAVAVRLIQLTD
jgi:hypothetical protein